MPAPKPQPVTCPKCGQLGNERPGVTLGEFPVEAVFVGDELVPTPQKLTCNNCGHFWSVARGSIEVRKP